MYNAGMVEEQYNTLWLIKLYY